MTSKNTLSAKNLEALGAGRLAELLIEISAGNAAAKRRLRLALAGAQSPGEVAKEVRKRLTAIARSQSFVDWQNRRILVEDLETQRRAIVDQVAKADPPEALELICRFMALANPVFGRCDDSSGTVIGVFHAACRDLGERYCSRCSTVLTKLHSAHLDHDGRTTKSRGHLSGASGNDGMAKSVRSKSEYVDPISFVP